MADRLTSVALGGAAFWLPAALLVASKKDPNLIVGNILTVTCAPCAYWLLSRLTGLRELRFLALYMLAGIYLLGPLAMVTSSWIVNGGSPPVLA